jgi:hypothetical protein
MPWDGKILCERRILLCWGDDVVRFRGYHYALLIVWDGEIKTLCSQTKESKSCKS